MSNDNNDKPFNEPDEDPGSFPVSREPASTGPAAPFVPCPDCRGSGRVVLLTSSRRACRRCGGAGRVEPAGGEAGRTVEAPDGSIRTYDGHGRLTCVVWPEGQTVVVDCDDAGGPDRRAAEAAAEGARSYSCTYDGQGRLLSDAWTGSWQTVVFGPPPSDPGDAPGG